MKRSYPLTLTLLVVLAALAPFQLSAQQKENNSLLWRISGNGLSQPSWLYGTIHLTDKRVFNFGDSLYAALEACEGYAMEIDVDTMMACYLRRIESKKEELLKSALTAKDFNRIKVKLKERFKKAPERVTVEEFRDYFVKTVNKKGKGDMDNIMDIWFYNAVRRQGKWVGGIEDCIDQEGLRDEVPLADYLDDFLNNHQESRKAIEKMIAAYLAEDLENVEMMSSAGGRSLHDVIILRRNRKMARRIDSLARIRRTFFTVGTAHLPGDSGVISHLRRRGFKVEPVHSTTRIAAESWRFTEKERPWVTVEASDGSYTVQFPGAPQKNGGEEDVASMKMYMDAETQLVYLSMSVEASPGLNTDSMLALMVKNMDRKASIIDRKSIVYNGANGKEIFATGGEVKIRARCFYVGPMVYVVLAGTEEDSLLRSAPVDRFFQSFVMHEKKNEPAVAWDSYTYAKQGFSLRFPVRPRVRVTDKAGSEMVTTNYSASDDASGVYYQCLVQDMRQGYFLTSDSVAFSLYVKNAKDNMGQTEVSSYSLTVDGYPAMHRVLRAESDGQILDNVMLNVHRGNRIYYLFATTADTVKNGATIQDYFKSLQFLPYQQLAWHVNRASDDDFSTWAPANIVGMIDSTGRAYTDKMYESYDSSSATTYYIGKGGYSPYYWTKNDSALLRSVVSSYMKANDSLLSYKEVVSGSHKGVEAVSTHYGSHNHKKLRILIVGDSLYYAYVVADPALLATENSNRFFSDLTVRREAPTALFTRKPAALLRALRSDDSTQHSLALQAIRQVEFEQQDLPLLHQALLEKYHDFDDGHEATNSLIDVIRTLHDSSTIGFIKSSWGKLPASSEHIRYPLLSLIAGYKTLPAVTLAKELLISHTPTDGAAWSFFRQLYDSLDLSAAVLPDLMPLLSDSLASVPVIELAEHLLDTNKIQLDLIRSHKSKLYQLAASSYRMAKAGNKDDYFNYSSLIGILPRLKEAEAYQWTRKFLSLPQMYLKYTAAIALIKAGQPVEAAELLRLAADKEQRVDLYNALKELKKLSLFPKLYHTQQAIGEGEVYAAAYEDNEVKKMNFIGERIASYKGRKKKFYLYKVELAGEDENVVYLGVAGPYNITPGPIVTGNNITGIYWNKEYNAATIAADLKDYLKQWEDYDKEQVVEE